MGFRQYQPCMDTSQSPAPLGRGHITRRGFFSRVGIMTYPGHIPVICSLYVVLIHLLHQELPVDELVTIPQPFIAALQIPDLHHHLQERHQTGISFDIFLTDVFQIHCKSGYLRVRELYIIYMVSLKAHKIPPQVW